MGFGRGHGLRFPQILPHRRSYEQEVVPIANGIAILGVGVLKSLHRGEPNALERSGSEKSGKYRLAAVGEDLFAGKSWKSTRRCLGRKKQPDTASTLSPETSLCQVRNGRPTASGGVVRRRVTAKEICK